jgi:hypothetical protein
LLSSPQKGVLMKTKQYSLMITLKSLSALLYKISLERGDFNLQTSAKAMELWISSDWRKLSDANPRMPDHLDWTTEKEGISIPQIAIELKIVWGLIPHLPATEIFRQLVIPL